MPTLITWNEADAPRDDNEHRAAAWLASVARTVGLRSVTDENTPEWLWRYAFTMETRGAETYDAGRLASVLQRFRSVTIAGSVESWTREKFVGDILNDVRDVASERAEEIVAGLLSKA